MFRRSNPGRSFTVQSEGMAVVCERVSPTRIELAVAAPAMALDEDEAMAVLEGLADLLGCRVERLP